MVRALYTALAYALAPVALSRLLWRSRRAPAYRERLPERFGFAPPLAGNPIWIHAVSVGESQAALPLARAIRAQWPDTPLLITTTTPTGYDQIRRALGDEVHHRYLPYDLPDALNRFLRRIEPRLLVVMETELWPNLFAACGHQRIPVLVANGRLSARSAQSYRRYRRLSRYVMRRITTIGAQTEQDRERFIHIGADPERVRVTGSLKFDVPMPASVREAGQVLRRFCGGAQRRVWVAASTHSGEEAPILEAHAAVRARIPDALLILAPRHPERFKAVEAQARQRFEVVTRSSGQPCRDATAVYLGDAMGELPVLLAAADLAFVGGSLVPTGGHNVLEPAALGVPVLTGPKAHVFNFLSLCTRLEAAGGLAYLDAVADLPHKVTDLLNDPAARDRMGERGQAFVARNRGAVDRSLAMICEHIP